MVPCRAMATVQKFFMAPEDEAAFFRFLGEIGAAIVDKVKRGPDKGSWRIDEVRSPVIFMERSRKNEEGELLSGVFWAAA